MKKSTFCSFFSFKTIKLSIFRFENRVKHNASHINQTNIAGLDPNEHFEAVLIAYHFYSFVVYIP